MSKKLCLALGLLTFFMHSWARAEVVYTTVFNVFESIRTEKILVLSAVDGRVYKTAKSKENLALMKSFVGQVVRLDYQTIGSEAYITAIRPAPANEIDPRVYDLNHFKYDELRRFAPTDLQTVEAATNVFKSMINDGDKRRSQCFKRAHMWVYDMWSKMGLQTEKVFIFFTQRKQMIDEFDWWFHVAPVATVNGEKYVLDGTFFMKPVPLLEWKNFFMKTDKINCPMIEKYQQYEKHQWTKLCYLMLTPMYYFRPADMEKRDKEGAAKNHWVLEELQDARNAFKNSEDQYEGLDTGSKTITH